MKKIALLALWALPFTIAQVQAGNITTEPVATAYWDIPLGKTRTGKELQTFGLRMDQVSHDSQSALFSTATRTPVVDFRFNNTGMQGVYVRGINMANPSIMKLGVEEAVLWIAGGFVLGATALIIEAENHGGSTCATVTLNMGGCDAFAGYGLHGAATSCCPR